MNTNANEKIDIAILMVLSALFFTSLAGAVVYFVFMYQKRQAKNIQEQAEREAGFRQELLKTQLEVQEQTFSYVSREIHDNITQVLSFIKLNLGLMAKKQEKESQLKLNENKELVSQVINDLRNLSKSLSFEYITQVGLAETIKIDVERLNKSGVLNVELSVEGEGYSLGEQRELVLFRIFQEALNNALKHANATIFKITLQYHPQLFNLTIEDDGSGFSAETLVNKLGSGLKNIQNRATLIGANATIDSSPGKGCCVSVALNPIEQKH